MILLSGGASALCAIRFERKKVSVLQAWIDLISYFRDQIDCFLMPIDDILKKADPQILPVTPKKNTAPTLGSLLRDSSPYLDAQSVRLLDTMIREMGSCYREEQVKRCDFYIQALLKKQDELACALPGRIKLCLTLSLCAAVGTAVLLW